jgi:hypothetical protein
MRRLGFALVLSLAATAAFAQGTFIVHGDDCSSRNFSWDGEESFVARQTIDAGALRSFKATVDHAPISVVGGSTRGYSVEVCKAAARREDLDAIRVSVEGGELRTSGPEGSRWSVHYKVHVPDNANIEIEADNGPISIRDVNGTVVTRASNGPLSLRNLSGNIDATTTNGPISIRGGSGTMKVRASNGPLSVDLDGTSWRNGSLDASTRNGPLSLKIPRNYGSGVVVDSNGRGPLSCKAEGCQRYRSASEDGDRRGRHWDDEPRHIELGSGAEAVRLSTVNGPITIKDDE